MRTSGLLFAGFGLLGGCSFAAPTTNSMPPFEITNTKYHQVEGGNTTIAFTVYDPNPLTNATTECTDSWETGSTDYPSGTYLSCANDTFAWNFDSIQGIGSFVLSIEHAYEDPSVGSPPYDEVITYGKANVTEPSVKCEAMGGQASCEQRPNTTIKAPIWAVTAKR